MKPQTSLFFADRHITRPFIGIWGVALFLATFFCIGISVPTHATGIGVTPQIGLQPAYVDPKYLSQGYFIFKSNPGTHIQNAVRVVNFGTVAGHATLYGMDATTGTTSGAIYQDKTAKRQDVGKWLTLGTSLLTLTPGQSMLIPFVITLPQNVRSGVHLGGIGLEVTPIVNTAKMPNTRAVGMQIFTHLIIVIAVEVIIPGTPIESLSASGIQAGGVNNNQTLQLNLHNMGNQMLKPFGTLQILDTHRTPLQILPVKLDTFLPMDSIAYPVHVKQTLRAGNYQAVLTLTYGDNHTLQYSTPFTITDQQIHQTFPNDDTLQAPALARALPLWILLTGGFLVLCGLLFLAQHGHRFILTARYKREGKNREIQGTHLQRPQLAQRNRIFHTRS